MKRILAAILLLVCSATTATTAGAAEISHHQGGVANIQDFMVPPQSGFYGGVYNFYYQSGRLNDQNGHETSQTVHVPGSTVDVYPDVDVYAMSIPLIWVEKELFWRKNGADKPKVIDYAFAVAPTLANNSVSTALTLEGEQGKSIDSGFGFGDLFVQPLWLGGSIAHWGYAVSWGFYAPTGKYNTGIQSDGIRDLSAKNIGTGFWTNQFRTALRWSPFAGKTWDVAGRNVPAPALFGTLTYEINSHKEDFHIRPGQTLSVNWGISEFIPLRMITDWETPWAVEFGPMGYDGWQVTADRGADRENGLLDQVHAAGFQLGFTQTTSLTTINFHYANEYASESRFQGHVVGLNFTIHYECSLQKKNCHED